MSHLVLELALWILLAFFVGCMLGCLLRRLFAGEPAAAVASGPSQFTSVTAPVPTAPDVKAEAAAVVAEAQALAGAPARPTGMAAARGGTPDNLQRISGVGPKNEKTLHSLGFFHFDQIAAWTPEEVSWVDDHLKFGGRIAREEWINQARLLAEGKEDEFHRLYGTGGMRNKAGETESGARTRKD
jgi:predicted flap endonuclease-1-like 5' DNA nuclease